MQFTTLLAAAAAFAGVNAVQFTNPAFNNLTAGQPFEFTWAAASGPVTIELKNGPSTNLRTVSTITTGQTGTSFTWPVPASLPADTYAFEIKDASGSNYSPQVQIIGATASASISSAVSSASSAISSASSSLSAAISSITAGANSTASSSVLPSGSPVPTGGSNSTITTGRPTGTTTRAPGSPSTTAGGAGGASGTAAAPPNSGVGSDFASPLALVFLTFAAIFTLN